MPGRWDRADRARCHDVLCFQRDVDSVPLRHRNDQVSRRSVEAHSGPPTTSRWSKTWRWKVYAISSWSVTFFAVSRKQVLTTDN